MLIFFTEREKHEDNAQSTQILVQKQTEVFEVAR